MSLIKRSLWSVVLATACMLPAARGFAEGPAGGAPAPAAAAASGAKADMLMMIHDARDKLIDLAEATPEAKFKYRPGKDVRSTAEVFMHVAAANFGIPNYWGVAPPEGFTMDFEKSLTKKADIIKALTDSFAHLEKGLNSISEKDYDKPVELFGGYIKTTIRGGYLLLMSHAHEHLGQSIAYARVNKIVPPWTARQQAAAKEAAKAKKDEAK